MQSQTTTRDPVNPHIAGPILLLIVVIAALSVYVLADVAKIHELPSIPDPGPSAHPSDPLRVVPEATGWTSQTLKVRTSNEDLRPFKNVLEQDILEHGGFITRHKGAYYTVQVSRQYLERLEPLAQASALGQYESAYQAWAALPNASASPDADAVVEAEIAVWTNERTRMAVWFWPTMAAIIIAALGMMVMVAAKMLDF